MPNFLINVTAKGVKGATKGVRKLTNSLKSLGTLNLAKAAGTSIQMIDATYSHILVEKNTEALTKAQGALKMLEVDLSTNVI